MIDTECCRSPRPAVCCNGPRERARLSCSATSSSSSSSDVEERAAERWWSEQGATAADLKGIAASLQHTAYWVPDAAEAKLRRLQQVLPGVDVARMLCKEPKNLLLGCSTTVARVVELTQLLAVSDIATVIATQPELLRCEDIPRRAEIAWRKLREWVPHAHSSELLTQHPELLLRIPDHYKDKSVHELPVYILNMIAVGGGGAGAVWRDHGFSRGVQ